MARIKVDNVLTISMSILISNVPGIISVLLPACDSSKGFFGISLLVLSWASRALFLYYILGDKKNKIPYIGKFWGGVSRIIIWSILAVSINVTYNRDTGQTDELTRIFNEKIDFSPTICKNEK